MVLQSHYRAPLTYTEEGLLAAERGLDRLRAAADARRASGRLAMTNRRRTRRVDLAALAAETDTRFHDAMDDDFNAPEALAALFDLGRAINRARGEPGSRRGDRAGAGDAGRPGRRARARS